MNIFFLSGRRLTDTMAEFIVGRSTLCWPLSFLQIKENKSYLTALSCSTITLYKVVLPFKSIFEKQLSIGMIGLKWYCLLHCTRWLLTFTSMVEELNSSFNTESSDVLSLCCTWNPILFKSVPYEIKARL